MRALVVSVALLLCVSARAEDTSAPAVLYLEGNKLMRVQVDSAPEEVAPIPDISASELRVAGKSVVVVGPQMSAWLRLESETRAPKGESRSPILIPCGPPVALSPQGEHLACRSQESARVVVYSLRDALTAEPLSETGVEKFAFQGPNIAYTSSLPGISATPLSDMSKTSRLAPHRPTGLLLITPDGTRAVGAYREEQIEVTYTFKLDGKGVRRTLVHAAFPVAISRNSRWAAVQQEVDACAVRLAGGQYMCWRRYDAVDISSEGSFLLVRRSGENGFEYGVAKVEGTSARMPATVVHTPGPAAFLED